MPKAELRAPLNLFDFEPFGSLAAAINSAYFVLGQLGSRDQLSLLWGGPKAAEVSHKKRVVNNLKHCESPMPKASECSAQGRRPNYGHLGGLKVI